MSNAGLVLARLVETPALVATVRALAPPAFATLVRTIGIEDAGELVALATTEQLVAAFDADLFANARPGAREEFDAGRFATWLAVLLEAGDAAVARRVTELDFDFVVRALGALVLVLDREALMLRMSEGDDDARVADKAIESSLSEEIEGYLLIARQVDGWDAVMALVAALDRDARDFLVRVLDRCAAAASDYVEDLAALAGVLSDADSLADDVEAAREARRAAGGYVEPRAAKAFLATPPSAARDPLTRAYFRELAPDAAIVDAELPEELRALAASGGALPAPASPVIEALRALPDALYAARLRELAYLANVVVAGAVPPGGGRYEAHAASQLVLDTIARAAAGRGVPIAEALRAAPADVLFREGYRA